ncbi:MAG TPA: hypothetical protein VEB20_18850 [Azospirillaceae bacterium]|nr:hypothetical protein [Azospirillaceae bacterium]
MREDAFERDAGGDWVAVALHGGAATLRVPAGWRRASRDDGGLAFQSPGARPMDLLLSLTTAKDGGGDAALLPHGIPTTGDGGRRWIAYTVGDGADDRVYVWKVTELKPALPARVVTVQLHVPAGGAAGDLDGLVERLGEETAQLEFAPLQLARGFEEMCEVAHAGLVRFRLPGDWMCEQDEELSEFFPEGEGAGTLKVVAYSFPHREAGSRGVAAALRILQRTASGFAEGPDGRAGHGSLEQLPEGEVMARFAAAAQDDGIGGQVRQHLWLRGAVSEDRTTLALFSYLQADMADDAEVAILAMLDREIRAALLGGDAADDMAGEEEADDPFAALGTGGDPWNASADLHDLAEELGFDPDFDDDDQGGGPTSH